MIIAVYCLLILVASWLGGILPAIIRMTHTRMQVVMSFVGGVMMGVAVLHMLPHAAQQLESVSTAAQATLAGLVAMFVLIRVFHAHHHVHPEETGDSNGAQHDHDHDHDHAQGHSHDHGCGGATSCHIHEISWFGLFVGLAIHTLLDGIALAASVTVAVAKGGSTAGLVGLGTFVSILLHKPLDALSITSVMMAGKWRAPWTHLVNLAFALMCPLGALLFLFGVQHLGSQTEIVGWALGFSAGVFLCVSLGDILPEVQFHTHDKALLTTALFLGVAIAWGIGWIDYAGWQWLGMMPQ